MTVVPGGMGRSGTGLRARTRVWITARNLRIIWMSSSSRRTSPETCGAKTSPPRRFMKAECVVACRAASSSKAHGPASASAAAARPRRPGAPAGFRFRRPARRFPGYLPGDRARAGGAPRRRCETASERRLAAWPSGPPRRAVGYPSASDSSVPSRIRKRSTSPVTVSRKPLYSSSV